MYLAPRISDSKERKPRTLTMVARITPEKTNLEIGYTFCSKSDQYVKRVGIILATNWLKDNHPLLSIRLPNIASVGEQAWETAVIEHLKRIQKDMEEHPNDYTHIIHTQRPVFRRLALNRTK